MMKNAPRKPQRFARPAASWMRGSSPRMTNQHFPYLMRVSAYPLHSGPAKGRTRNPTVGAMHVRAPLTRHLFHVVADLVRHATLSIVMAGLDPAIHDEDAPGKP
jgi:hypothetical protein